MFSLRGSLAGATGLVLVFALLSDGCRGPAPAPVQPVRHVLNEEAIAQNDELARDSQGREALELALAEHFGSPEDPRYLVLERWSEQGFDPNRWEDDGGADEPVPSLAESAALFRVRCAPCHGVSGGGDGRLAGRLRTRPRDYRHGVFKKTPLANRARPRREDLERTITEGIPDTAMRRWAASHSGAEIAGLAELVRLLAIRGETERMAIFDFEADVGLDLEAFQESYALAIERWRAGDGQLIRPGEPPEATSERIAHGRTLFLDPRGAACVRCHGSEGHGDGEAALVTDPLTGEQVPFLDEWGNPIRPRDLVCSPLRFGDGLEDIYLRIHAGINGTPMPAHEGLPVVEPDGSQHPVGPDDLWDLVLYVDSLRR